MILGYYWHPWAVERDLSDYLVQFNELPFERTLEIYRKRKLLEIIGSEITTPKTILEVGPGLNPLFPSLTNTSSVVVLEPIITIYEQLLKSSSGENHISISNLLLENYIQENPNAKFDLIILSSVLHEIPNPKEILKQIHSVLNFNGILLVVVPNNQSIHRLIGEHKGLVKSLTDLTGTEIMMQQFSSYSPETLKQIFSETGFSSSEVITSFIKPLPHIKMQEAMDSLQIRNEDLEFLYNISNFLQGYGSEIFGLARR
jgi:SAM-dependent methyltransferase